MATTCSSFDEYRNSHKTISRRAAAAPDPEIRRECPMTRLTALPLLATNPGDATIPISKALKYGPCVTGGSQFYLPPTHEPCLYSPAARCRHSLAGTHCAYTRRDGQVELTWVAGYMPR